MPKTYKRKAVVLSVGLFFAYAGMWIIMAAAERRAKLNEEFYSAFSVGFLIYNNIKYLLGGLALALIPYELLLEKARSFFAHRYKGKAKDRKLWSAVLLAACNVLAGYACGLVMREERAALLVFGLWLFTSIYFFEWIENSYKNWLAVMAISMFDVWLIYQITSQFILAAIVYGVMLLFFVIYGTVKNRKFNWYLFLCSMALAGMIVILALSLTNHGYKVGWWLNSDMYDAFYIEGLFLANKLKGWLVVRDHPFTMIYTYGGFYPFLIFIGLFIVSAILAVLSCKLVLKYSVKRCGIILGFYGLFAAMYIYACLADAGIFPTCMTGILRNHVDFIGLALVFRSFVLVPVQPVKEKELPKPALEQEDINVLTEKISALLESQEELLKRFAVQEGKIDRLERQLLRQCQRQKTGGHRFISKSRKYIRLSVSNQDDR